MMINFMGSIPSMLVMDNAEKIADIDPELLVENSEIMAYMQDALPVISVTFIQYLLSFIGFILLIKFIFDGNHKLSRECDIKLPFYRLPRVAIFNIGTILYIAMCVFEIAASLMPTA